MRLIVWFLIGCLVASLALFALPALLIVLVGIWLVRALA